MSEAATPGAAAGPPTKTPDERSQEHHFGDRAVGHGADRVADLLRPAAARPAAPAAATASTAAPTAGTAAAGAADARRPDGAAWASARHPPGARAGGAGGRSAAIARDGDCGFTPGQDRNPAACRL